MNVVTHYLTTRTRCLLRAVVSNGIFVCASTFVYWLHVGASEWAGHICCLQKADYIAVPHGLMSSPHTCISIRIYVMKYGGVEHFIFRLVYA